MYSIFIGSLLLSLFHAVIPNHWLPVLAIGKKDNWTLQEVTRVTFISGLAHALSTVAIGIILGVLGLQLANKIEYFTHFIAPAVFILSGSFFIYQHHRHKHFHLHKTPRPTLPKNKIILALVVAMFLSPCMEMEAYFLLAGVYGLWAVTGIAALYLTISISGMVLWVRLAYKGILKLNWHTLEHKSGIITGVTLVITGIISFFFLLIKLYGKGMLRYRRQRCTKKGIVNQPKNTKAHDHNADDGHDHEEGDHEEDDDHAHCGEDLDGWKSHCPLLSSLAILFVMLVLEFRFKYKPVFPVDLIIYVVAYLLAGYNV